MARPKLFTYKESGNCYKVRLLAALLQIDLQEIELDFDNDEHKSPKFLLISPRGTIPTLVDGDRVFTDSSAILVYLAGTHTDAGSSKTPSSWWSVDIAEQAAIVDWLAFAATWVENGVCAARTLLSFEGMYNGLGSANPDQTLVEAKIKGLKSLEILQKKLEEGEWLALRRPTIADIAVFAYVALAPMGDVSLETYPAVKGWIARMRNLPHFITIQGLDDPMYRRQNAGIGKGSNSMERDVGAI